MKNPRTNEVRYVGWTSKTLQARLNQHIRDAIKKQDQRRCRWIMSLLASGIQPVIEAVEYGTGESSWAEAERRWIAGFKTAGARLVNSTDGGEGLLNWGTPEERSAAIRKQHAQRTPAERSERAKRQWAKLSAEQRTAIVEKGWSHFSPEQRSEINRARRLQSSPEERSAAAKRSTVTRHSKMTREEIIAIGRRAAAASRAAKNSGRA